MATENKSSETGDWSWSSWISSAKEKSIAALNATSRDLAEFVTVVQGDTTSAVTGAATKVKQIINQEQKEGDDDDSQDGPSSTSTGKSEEKGKSEAEAVYDRSITHLELIRADPNTYCTVPEGKSAEFLEWSSGFDLSNQQEEISRLLVASNSVRRLHSTLVPAKVSYESFWYNYFYRIHLLDKTEAHRAEIMARVHSQGQMICWDDDELVDDSTGDVIVAKRNFDASNIDHERAMTDSSESFVCINEEGHPINEGDPAINEEEELNVNEGAELDIKESVDELITSTDKKKDVDSDDEGWEKWSDS